MKLIEVSELGKVFRRGGEEVWALKNLTLAIPAGEFVAITGSSGSGKSTLLYILGLLDSPSKGAYFFENEPTVSLSDDARAMLRNKVMGFVFQSFHLLSRASALRNVMMPMVYAANYGQGVPAREQRERAEAALVRVGLGDRLSHLPNELSGGQRQRVAIARALVNNPRVVFADEPTGNLDSRNGREILSLFEQLNSEGVTIVMVTHDPLIAGRASRQIVLKDGELEKDSHASR
jgi:putative ABC transport system ATP-binding protein